MAGQVGARRAVCVVLALSRSSDGSGRCLLSYIPRGLERGFKSGGSGRIERKKGPLFQLAAR